MKRKIKIGICNKCGNWIFKVIAEEANTILEAKCKCGESNNYKLEDGFEDLAPQ